VNPFCHLLACVKIEPVGGACRRGLLSVHSVCRRGLLAARQGVLARCLDKVELVGWVSRLGLMAGLVGGAC